MRVGYLMGKKLDIKTVNVLFFVMIIITIILFKIRFL